MAVEAQDTDPDAISTLFLGKNKSILTTIQLADVLFLHSMERTQIKESSNQTWKLTIRAIASVPTELCGGDIRHRDQIQKNHIGHLNEKYGGINLRSKQAKSSYGYFQSNQLIFLANTSHRKESMCMASLSEHKIPNNVNWR